MKNNYRAKIAELLLRAYPKLAATHQLEFKNVFGAVGGYLNGRIFASCGKFGFALRLPPETLCALFREKEASPLKYFPNGHVKKEYAVLHKRILEDKGRLGKLVNVSVQYTLSLQTTRSTTRIQAQELTTEQIWLAFHKQLLLYIKKRVNNREDAEDILQDVFIKIHHNISNLKQTATIVSWLYRITRNAVIDFYRKGGSLPGTVEDEAFVLDQAQVEGGDATIDELTELAKCLRPMIGRLPPKYQMAVEAVEVLGRSQKEIANELGMSLSGAKSRVQRGRKMLRDLLEECCHFEYDVHGNVMSHYARQKNCASCN